MSADEDTELRDLVAQTLETNGVLGRIRAELRANVFLALEDQESVKNKTPFLNQDLKKFISTKEGHNVVELIREFLDFFNLEFTQAVFGPESGCGSNVETRGHLAKELSLPDASGGAAAKQPLLLEVLKRAQGSHSVARSVGEETGLTLTTLPQELSQKQLADARKKFDYYDRDKNNEIDKEELRGLFVDLFPSFNRNMLDRYVNDEFRATDKDFSNSISFQEFLGMYKRLFLQCRGVVSGDVADILSPVSTHKSLSSPVSKASTSERSERSQVDSRNRKNLENGPKSFQQDNNNTDTEEDFFDDPLPTSPGYKSFGSDDKRTDKASTNGVAAQKSGAAGTKGQGPGSMSSLQGLPSLTGDKNQGIRKSPTNERSDNLRSMDKRMADLGLEGDAQDYSYEEDFQSEGHSISQRNRSEVKSDQNGSIAEEIEEDIEEVSIEGDFLHSEKSAFDDITTDRTISQVETGYDYIEELQSP
ncbi:centrosomal protein 43-like isoform X2 [Dreissena polymorpha]|uniref:centrosomal protein 43-like isoform X2 n=1 Tax=Dreissena polymorpha TaxID=45954 RepID=UPI0022655EF6|nr:centrosomal protein 43-like isoform X2 [Dreissena polymorpha]